jgi:hypothetical protein
VLIVRMRAELAQRRLRALQLQEESRTVATATLEAR